MGMQEPRVEDNIEHHFWLYAGVLYCAAMLMLGAMTWYRYVLGIAPADGAVSAGEVFGSLPGAVIGLVAFGTLLQGVTVYALVRRQRLALLSLWLIVAVNIAVLAYMIATNNPHAEMAFDNGVIGIACTAGLGIWSIFAVRRGILK